MMDADLPQVRCSRGANIGQVGQLFYMGAIGLGRVHDRIVSRGGRCVFPRGTCDSGPRVRDVIS